MAAKPSETKIGYLLIASPVTNVYIGGIMVVDERGLPLEFRYTEPIQPTKIQQVLYGSVLNRYIKTDVILETLLKSLESKPNLLVVNDDSFMMTDVLSKDFDVVRLTETKSPPLKAPGDIEKISAYEFLLQLTSESSPIRVQLPGSTGDGKDPIGGLKALPDKSAEDSTEDTITSSEAYRLLFEIGRVTDILEPQKRVEKALALLCQEAGMKAAAS